MHFQFNPSLFVWFVYSLKVGDSARVGGGAFKKEDSVENIAAPIQETMQ